VRCRLCLSVRTPRTSVYRMFSGLGRNFRCEQAAMNDVAMHIPRKPREYPDMRESRELRRTTPTSSAALDIALTLNYFEHHSLDTGLRPQLRV
jgi:hypothetical protein